MATYEEVTAEAAIAKTLSPKLIVGACEKDGRFSLVTGSNRSRLNSFRRMGYEIYEFIDGNLQRK